MGLNYETKVNCEICKKEISVARNYYEEDNEMFLCQWCGIGRLCKTDKDHQCSLCI